MGSTVRTTDTPFVETTLTFRTDWRSEENIRSAVTHAVACGPAAHVVHGSNLYVGDVAVDPYLETSPLALLNSRIASEGDVVLPSPAQTLPVSNDPGDRERVELESAVSVPEVSCDEITPESAVLSVGDRELSVDRGDDVILEPESRSVEIEVSSDATVEMAYAKPFSGEVIEAGSTEPVQARVTEHESVSVTPRIRVVHHGVASVFGVDDGVVLPRDEANPMARRAMREDAPDTEVVQPDDASGESVIVVERGES